MPVARSVPAASQSLLLQPSLLSCTRFVPVLRVSVRPDVRAAWLARLSNAPCSRIIALLWPRLLPLHPLVQSPPPPGQPIELPEPVSSLSARVLDQKGIYLLENGSSAVVHFGPDAPPEHIMVLLGE